MSLKAKLRLWIFSVGTSWGQAKTTSLSSRTFYNNLWGEFPPIVKSSGEVFSHILVFFVSPHRQVLTCGLENLVLPGFENDWNAYWSSLRLWDIMTLWPSQPISVPLFPNYSRKKKGRGNANCQRGGLLFLFLSLTPCALSSSGSKGVSISLSQSPPNFPSHFPLL